MILDFLKYTDPICLNFEVFSGDSRSSPSYPQGHAFVRTSSWEFSLPGEDRTAILIFKYDQYNLHEIFYK